MLLHKKITNMPPCGAFRVRPKRCERVAPTAPPAIKQGMYKSGLPAANGMANSLIMAKPPIIQPEVVPLSAVVKRFLAMSIAIPTAKGGIIEAIKLAAIGA